jgi:hypothetical protein
MQNLYLLTGGALPRPIGPPPRPAADYKLVGKGDQEIIKR